MPPLMRDEIFLSKGLRLDVQSRASSCANAHLGPPTENAMRNTILFYTMTSPRVKRATPSQEKSLTMAKPKKTETVSLTLESQQKQPMPPVSLKPHLVSPVIIPNLKILPVFVSHCDLPEKKVKVYTLLDNASDTTFVTTNVQQALTIDEIQS